jgi:glycerophosphoryl diester phosphodiesterase
VILGGVVPPQPTPPARQVTLLQRKSGKPGRGLGKTTGWIHRAALQMKQVQMMSGVHYERITPQGLLVSFGDQRRADRAAPRLIECDTVVLCAGQEPLRDLHTPLQAAGLSVHPYTIRADSLPPTARSLDDLHSLLLNDAKVDGLFTDFPDRTSAWLISHPSLTH